MNEILNHSSYDGFNWKDGINKYVYNKTNIGWGSTKALNPKITLKMVKENDVIFNTIIKKYNDPKNEATLQKDEKSAIISEIIKNQDNQLKVQRTFNIINLKDRLKGLENDPNYPSMKDLNHSRKRIESNPKNYNTINHSFISPPWFENFPFFGGKIIKS